MRVHFWLCVLCLTACAHRVQAEPVAQSGSRAEPRASTGRAGAGDEAQAAAYSSQPTPGELLGDAADPPLRQALASACAKHKLVLDGRLSELARAVARAS